MIGAITATAVYAVLVGVLVGFSPAGGPTKRAAFAAAAAWGGLIVAVAALGGFAPGATGPVPAPLFAFAGLLALLFGGWFLSPRFRSALLSVPLPALVWLAVWGLGGLLCQLEPDTKGVRTVSGSLYVVEDTQERLDRMYRVGPVGPK